MFELVGHLPGIERMELLGACALSGCDHPADLKRRSRFRTRLRAAELGPPGDLRRGFAAALATTPS